MPKYSYHCSRELALGAVYDALDNLGIVATDTDSSSGTIQFTFEHKKVTVLVKSEGMCSSISVNPASEDADICRVFIDEVNFAINKGA